MAYEPIENYGVIGNLRTTAHVSIHGSIDWLCLPKFDSPSVFGGILDDKKGGAFKISPEMSDARIEQFYYPDTNILITRFLHADGVGELEDFMPIASSGSTAQLVRRVRVKRGTLPFIVSCLPAFDYARKKHELTEVPHGFKFTTPELTLVLKSTVEVRPDGSGGVVGEFTLKEGESRTFLLAMVQDRDVPPCPTENQVEEWFRDTVRYWQQWLSSCTYRGRWREMVHRSALALKLMSYEPTGAIVAAPTTSLPEGIGGVRNWDYRFTWIRDASFTLYALLRIGFREEAVKFMHWLSGRFRFGDGCAEGPLQLMYTIDGKSDMPEEELSHLDGYMGSKPVRIGNAAHGQLQLDIYGELMDSVYLYNKYASPVGYDSWIHLRALVDWVCENWQREDDGIWEVRGGRRHFVYSKCMCWVAIDRGLRLADKRALPTNRRRWEDVRDTIYEEIMSKGYDTKRKSFVQAYGSDALDASNLLMPLTFFVAPNDPRMLHTIDAITASTSRGGLGADGLIYRYDTERSPDGLPGVEGTFNICSFWLVEALTRAGRTDPKRLAQARLLFEQMLSHANHVGLYAEQTGPSGEALGNFPQAFTHLALISAAFNLDRELDGGGRGA